ncbi:MAG: hypothetical protein WBC44_13380 [Planctomycetaceae bacterium]
MPGASALMMLSLLATDTVEVPHPVPREQIGAVLGQPIYRDQLRKKFPVRDELFRLIEPALQKYQEQHRKQIEPTDAELTFAADAFRRENPEHWREQDAEWKADLAEIRALVADPDFAKLPADERKAAAIRQRHLETSDAARDFARFILDSRKFNRHLYETFGGGRIVWQQGGVEAFDAHHRWLGSLEKRGDFSFADQELRAIFYEYWTNERQHRSFLSTPEKNPERIEEFLNPEWFPAEAAK